MRHSRRAGIALNDPPLAFLHPAARLKKLLLSFAMPIALGLSHSANAYESEQFQAAVESLSPKTVARWEEKARAGDVLAQNVMGMAYKYGLGIKQNHEMSGQWFRKAAEQGDADAQFNLGRIYGKGFGTYARTRAAPQDDVEAVYWYRRSAEQGYRPAQFSLAEIYAEGGRDIPQNYEQAYFWMSLAGSAGDTAARQKLESYATHMSAVQIAAAQELVVDWNRRRDGK